MGHMSQTTPLSVTFHRL